ncbi:Hypothetical predicted protein [Cloeon dipterum]|nr:Hypothetical predicted protein [Cloeon dipterum]
MSKNTTAKMKATLFSLLLNEELPNEPDKKVGMRNYLLHAIEQDHLLASQYLDICSLLLSVNDPEYLFLKSGLCEALRLAARLSGDNNPFNAFLQEDIVSDDAIVHCLQTKMPTNDSMREVIAKETLYLLITEDFWMHEKFVLLVQNVGRFSVYDEEYINAVFSVLEGFKPYFSAQTSMEIVKKVDMLIELSKKWMHANQKILVARKRLILNTLYQKIIHRKANHLMIYVLRLVEAEILTALLSPIPSESVPVVAKELLSWTYNTKDCYLLLPPIVKMLQRLLQDGNDLEYNQLALENCDKMLGLLHLKLFRPMISIVCHFLNNSTDPIELLKKSVEKLKMVLILCADDMSVSSNLRKALAAIFDSYPELRAVICNILSENLPEPDPSNPNLNITDGPKGLVNTGNTCYANSVIQCLYHITQFRNKVLKFEPDPCQTVLQQLQKIFALLRFSSLPEITPDETFHAILRPPYFVRGQQEDGFLYLIHLLDILKEQELKAVDIKDDEMEVNKEQCSSGAAAKCETPSDGSTEDSKSDLMLNGDNDELEEMSTSPDENSEGSSFPSVKSEGDECSNESTNNNFSEEEDNNVADEMARAYHTLNQEVFGGYQVETYCCHGCKYRHKQTKRTTAICLAIPEQETNQPRITDLLENYFKPVELQDSDKYECRKCNAKVDSTCYTELVSAPPYLILCLKRFLYNTSLQQTIKVMTQVQIEEDVSVKGWDFRLHAMVVHSGSSASHGHYYSVINTENCKLRLDDTSVSSGGGLSAHLDTPYILFYQRKDCQMDETADLCLEHLDARLQAIVRNQSRRPVFPKGLVVTVKKSHQPPPPPPPSCGDGPGISSNRMVC